ncbi:dentin sialophosphoprotein-like [Cydia amplana]|uniref:dentin sialophosphoprotein-like n=1 Tax=Cydia amplana TaxID=1869771 RepID=UPI002FE6B050
MRIFLIFFSAAIIIALADAQRKPNITKPVVNLEKRPRTSLWRRPPEERRKLSIFPKNNVKFVVTPKPVNDEPQESSTKRPLMRKFITQDKNEKGTWSFARREPLMKTQRFTVTAPPKSSNQKAIEEIKSEESLTVPIVLSDINTKHHSINKGNLIEAVKIQKNPAASKHKAEQRVTKVGIPQKTKINDTQDSKIDQKNDNKSRATFGEDLIDVRRFNDDGVHLDANETINTDQNEQKVLNKTTDTLNTEALEDIDDRAVDLNEIKYPIGHDNNSLKMDSEGSDNHKAGQILNINDLEIMLEKLVNITEKSNISSTSDLKDNGAFVILNNETSIDEIPQFDVTKSNDFYDVVTLSTDDKENIQGSFNKANEKMHHASDTNVLNDKDINEHEAETLIIGNLENQTNFVENDTVSAANSEMYQEQKESVGLKVQEFKINTGDTSKNTTAHTIDGEVTINDPIEELTTPLPTKDNKNDSDTSNSLNLSLEIYESNMPLSIEEISSDCDDNNCNESTPGKLNLTIEETSNEELIENLSFGEISNESTSGASNDYAEERSNESFSNSSDNLLNEHISNESSSNMAGEELSNEYNEDKSNNLTDEIVSESLVESSDNFTGEQFSNESSSNMAGEELSNEYFADKSINSEEISRDSIIENSNSFSVEQISNESSNITEEESSNESYLIDDITNESIETSDVITEEESSNESSSNPTSEEILNESYFIGNFSNESTEISYNFTVVSKELLSDNSDNVTDDRIPEVVASEQGTSTEDIAEGTLVNRFKRSNNIIEEESLPTTVSGFKYTGHEVRLNHDTSYKNINA